MEWKMVGKKMTLRALLAATVLIPLYAAPSAADQNSAGDIIVEISGASSDKGKILWRMFDNESDFEDPETGGILEGECDIQDRKCTFTIPSLAFGRYAIMAGHDANSDQDISKNPFSNEPKGITNYNEKIFWFPDFKKAIFKHDKSNTAIRLRLF